MANVGGIWQYDQNYLSHHGIKGMHWYQRRFQNEDGTLTAEGKARYRVAAAKNFLSKAGNTITVKANKKESVKAAKPVPESSTWKSKEAKFLSDEELNRRNNRLQRENQYVGLTKANDSKGEKAKAFLKSKADAIFVATAIGAIKSLATQKYRAAIPSIASKAGKAFMNSKVFSTSAKVLTSTILKKQVG